MNPRLTVSVLFVLFAIAAFRPEANDAFKKLKTLQHCWADKALDRCAAEILNRITSRVSGLKSEFLGHKGIVTTMVPGDRPVLARNRATENQPCKVGSLSPDGKIITLNSRDDINVPSARETNTQRRVTNLIDSDSHCAAFERVRTAVWQIEEVLDLIRIK